MKLSILKKGPRHLSQQSLSEIKLHFFVGQEGAKYRGGVHSIIPVGFFRGGAGCRAGAFYCSFFGGAGVKDVFPMSRCKAIIYFSTFYANKILDCGRVERLKRDLEHVASSALCGFAPAERKRFS